MYAERDESATIHKEEKTVKEGRVNKEENIRQSKEMWSKKAEEKTKFHTFV